MEKAIKNLLAQMPLNGEEAGHIMILDLISAYTDILNGGKRKGTNKLTQIAIKRSVPSIDEATGTAIFNEGFLTVFIDKYNELMSARDCLLISFLICLLSELSKGEKPAKENGWLTIDGVLKITLKATKNHRF